MSAARKRAPEPSRGFSAEEKAAMREALRERAPRRGGGADGEQELLAKIAAMPPSDRRLAEQFHALVRTHAPALVPKTWYGMPAYANSAGQVVCYFQDAHKFKARYATLGFSDKARLDDGSFWPVVFALTELTPAVTARVVALLRTAAGER